jgi:hypothetical protein
MHGTDTPGPEAPSSSPPVPPQSLWGIWQVGTNRVESLGWWIERPMPFDYFSLLAFASKEDAEAVVSMTSGPEGQKTSCVPALLGVSPAVVAQRDKLGEALAEAETAARSEMEWLQTISATASPRYRLVEGRQRRWAALLAEWRAAQEREGGRSMHHDQA